MPWTVRGFVLLLFVGCLVTSSRAQSSPPPPPLTADQILDKNIEALGGRTALEGVKSVVRKGVRNRTGNSLPINQHGVFVARPTEKGLDTIESYWKAGKNLFVLNAGTKEEMRAGAAEGLRWTSFQGSVTKGRIKQSSNAATSYFDFVVNWRQRYVKVELKGVKEAGDRKAYKLELTLPDGTQVEHYYDTETFLLLRSDYWSQGQAVVGHVAIPYYDAFSDYRVVGGVKFPFQIQSLVTGDLTLYSQTEINGELDDSLFQVPATKKK